MRFYPCLLGLCQSDLSRMLFAPVSTARLFSLTVARTATTAQGPTGSKWSSCPRLLQILFCVCCFWFSEIRIREQGVHLGDGPRQLGWARKWERGRGGGQAACSHASASRLSLWAPGAWSPWGTLGVRDHGPLPGHSFRRPRELGRRSSTSCRSRDGGCLRLRRLRWDVKKGAGTQAKSAGLKAPKLRASQEHGPRLPRSLHCGHFLAWRRAQAGPSAARDGMHQRTPTRHAFLDAPSLSVLLFPSEHLARAYKSFICGFCQFPISPHKCARLGAEGLSFPTISLAGRGIEHGPHHGHILKDM